VLRTPLSFSSLSALGLSRLCVRGRRDGGGLQDGCGGAVSAAELDLCAGAAAVAWMHRDGGEGR
jgi:hypothetical protein